MGVSSVLTLQCRAGDVGDGRRSEGRKTPESEVFLNFTEFLTSIFEIGCDKNVSEMTYFASSGT